MIKKKKKKEFALVQWIFPILIYSINYWTSLDRFPTINFGKNGVEYEFFFFWNKKKGRGEWSLLLISRFFLYPKRWRRPYIWLMCPSIQNWPADKRIKWPDWENRLSFIGGCISRDTGGGGRSSFSGYFPAGLYFGRIWV